MCSNHFCNKKRRKSIWKLSRLSGNFPGYLETFWTIRKLAGPSGNFPGYPEPFRTILTNRNFPDGLEISQCNFKGYAQKLSGCAKTFRMAMPPCHPGFWASVIYYYRRTDKSEKVWKCALPDITTAITTLRLLR